MCLLSPDSSYSVAVMDALVEIVFEVKMDKDGNGTISLTEYFAIFEEHGIKVNQSETNRVMKMAGEDGTLTKENFIKILRSSDLFLKAFDKNKDGIVTETEMMTRAELAFSALDRDNSGYISSRELRKLSTKLSDGEVQALMVKLDADGDGQLSLEEFKVLFDNAEKRKRDQKLAAQKEAQKHGSTESDHLSMTEENNVPKQKLSRKKT